MDLDKPMDGCGVFGIYNHSDAANIAQSALYALQHRGEESAGIAAARKGVITLYKGKGLVEDIFEGEEVGRLRGDSAIGHVRYSLIGESTVANAQPFVMDKGYNPDQTSEGEEVDYNHLFSKEYRHSPIAIAHNGNFLEGLEGICEGSDTKQFAAMLSKSPQKNIKQAILDLLQRIKGSYALGVLTPNMLVGARDPEGYRPLSVGSLDDAFVLSSESCAFNQIGARLIRDINPGEVLFIDKKGLHSEYLYTGAPPKRRECIFEHIYLARSDSIVFGKSVHTLRLDVGHILAREQPAKANIVICVPDAGNLYAQGFAKELKIPYEPDALKRNHYYPGRVFIQPEHESRLTGADLKFFVVPEAVKGKIVILIDDSIVRGINVRAAVRKLRQAGVKEIHVRIASPPYVSACQWGVDTYDTSKLIALNESLQEMIVDLDIDSLGYLSLEGLLSVFDNPENKCVHCFEEH